MIDPRSGQKLNSPNFGSFHQCSCAVPQRIIWQVLTWSTRRPHALFAVYIVAERHGTMVEAQLAIRVSAGLAHRPPEKSSNGKQGPWHVWFQSDRSARGQQTGQPDAGYPQRKSLRLGLVLLLGRTSLWQNSLNGFFLGVRKGNPLLVDFALETAMAIVGRLHVQNS